MVQGAKLDLEMTASGGGSESGRNLHSMVVKIPVSFLTSVAQSLRARILIIARAALSVQFSTQSDRTGNRTDSEMKHNGQTHSSLIPYLTSIETMTAPNIAALAQYQMR